MHKLRRLVSEAIKKNQATEYMLVNLSHHYLKRPYLPGEKIVIVFIFQSASFWPSWESVWTACVADPLFEPIMLVCDTALKEKTQFRSAQKFLKDREIPFRHVNDVNLSDLKPHIVVIHTPYDGHRPRSLYGKRLASLGYRTVYIPYGIEISDIEKARSDHFRCGVTTTAWRIYTFSEQIIPYYKIFSPTGGDMVRSFGHPKFDLLNKTHFPSLPADIQARAKGRKVVLWKVHFPKKVDGKMLTPPLEMYEAFLDRLSDYKDLFFIFMPHPKFYPEFAKFGDAEGFEHKLGAAENVVQFDDDDYRPVLMNCDYYIIDRSALMIEAGVTDKPILYVKTTMPEPMTIPVQTIVDTYYQATALEDLTSFIDEVVVPDDDPKKLERRAAFQSVIPDNGGAAGEQIKSDMATSLLGEATNEVRASNGVPRDEFAQSVERLFSEQDLSAAKIELAKDQIRNHLSYRLGSELIKASKSRSDLLHLPSALRKSYGEFLKARGQKENGKKGKGKQGILGLWPRSKRGA